MRKTLIIVLLLFPLSCFANWITCQIEMTKSSCWNNYEVKINLIDFATHKEIASFTLPKGKPKTMLVSYPCTPNEQVTFTAQNIPEVWQDNKDVLYSAIEIYQIPQTAPKDSKYYRVKVCYARDFQSVPMPIDSNLSHCQCVFDLPKAAASNHHPKVKTNH